MKELNGLMIRHLNDNFSLAGKEEFNNLVNSIDLSLDEKYDCTCLEVWSYRKASDIREGVPLCFGNMCNGFPLEIEGIRFYNSECAYIAGSFAGAHPEQVAIQKLVAEEKNGMRCKRIYRRRPEFTSHIRKDFYNYNVQWMMYVLWQKCLQNKHFADLLKAIPPEAHVVENTSFHSGATAVVWGAKNRELTRIRIAAEADIALNREFRFKKDLAQTQMMAANAINDKGFFEGCNVMGKIIKIGSLSLLYGQEPPINYSWLRSRNLLMCGKQIDFPVMSGDY